MTRWSDVRRRLPERAGPGFGFFDERIDGVSEIVGWRIWLSAEGHFRAEDERGQPLWIVRDWTSHVETKFFGFESGVPWRVGHEEGEWVVREPKKQPLCMLYPQMLDDLYEFRGCRVEVEPDVAGVRLVHVRWKDPKGMTLRVNLDLGLIESATAIAAPTQGSWIRDWTPTSDLDPELFEWRGEYRDSRPESHGYR